MNDTGSGFVNTRKIVYAGMFIAMSMVLKLFEVSVTQNFRVGLTTLPLMVSGMILGPFYGFMTGFLADILNFFLKGDGGAFHIGFSVSNGLYGLIPGLMAWWLNSRKKDFTLATIAVSVICCEVISSIVLNTLFLIQLYGAATTAIVPQRIVKAIVMMAVNTAILYVLYRNMKSMFKKFYGGSNGLQK